MSVHSPFFHLPIPVTVARFVNYTQSTAFKMARLQPQLDFVHLPDTEYPNLPLLHLPSELESSSKSHVYLPLKPIRKQSTSLSNLLDTTSHD